jgi:hypothetical protein
MQKIIGKGVGQLNKEIEELTLMLLYLTAWEEDVPPFGRHKRNWKSHSAKVLDKLDKDGLLVSSDKSDSVFLTSAGAIRAQALVQKYLGNSAVQLTNF